MESGSVTRILPVKPGEWNGVESLIGGRLVDEAVVFLCEGGCSVLLMCVVGDCVGVVPQCRSGGGTKDGKQVVGVERDQGHATGAVRMNEVVFWVDGMCECVVGGLCE